jgi:F-type H+-transporting ATPase subunit gamma
LRTVKLSSIEIGPSLYIDEPNKPAQIVAEEGIRFSLVNASNVIKEALPLIREKRESGLITIGRKARDYFKRRKFTIDAELTGFSEKPTYLHAVDIVKLASEGFLDGQYDEIYLVYTEFLSPIHQKPTTIKLLPVDHTAQQVDGKPEGQQEYIFEPSAEGVLSVLLPQYLETTVYNALLQAAASELGARMTAMSSATDNAEELIAKLTLNYNKVRQASITREISEIVGGVEALK